MPLRDDQLMAVNELLLGRFIAAVKAVAADIVAEDPLTVNHAARMALAKRVLLERQAPNYARTILEIAVARYAKLRGDGENVSDADIVAFVTQTMATLAVNGW